MEAGEGSWWDFIRGGEESGYFGEMLIGVAEKVWANEVGQEEEWWGVSG